MSYQWDNKKPTAQMLGRWQPFHDGHYKLIKLAEAECDSVIVYVSLTDRLPKTKERDNVAPVYGDDMVRIWKDYMVSLVLSSQWSRLSLP